MLTIRLYNKNALTLLMPGWLFGRLLIPTQVISGLPVARGGPTTCRPSFRSIISPPRPPRRDFPTPRAGPPVYCPEPALTNLTPLGHQVVKCDTFLVLILVVCLLFSICPLVLALQANQAASWQLAWGWLAAILATGLVSDWGYVL